MRSDLTANFITAKNAASRSPRQLAVFHFPLAGDVHISDQALGAADGLANEYAALVEDWGTLSDMAGGDPTDKQGSEVRQLSMTIWNGGASPFSDYFLKEAPEDVLVDVYQWFEGLSESDKALIDTLAVQDPIDYDEASLLLRLDVLSLAMRYDNPVGDLLDTDDWPNAKKTDIGKGIDLAIGSPGEVPTLVAKTAPVATLNGSILAGTMTINVNENLATLGFSASGVILIGEEYIDYSSRTTYSFTARIRGGRRESGALKYHRDWREEHLDRQDVSQVITDYTFLAGKGPVSAIDNVKVAGFPAPAIYTAYPALDPARIVFSEKPYAISYAKGSRFLEMHADQVNDDNTAFQAHHAYDAAAVASAAKISPTYPKLSIRQVTDNLDRGQIVKAYLAVEHWHSDRLFLNDYVEVAISGIGVVGRLSRPNVADTIDVEAEVDIDHGHTHAHGNEISDQHTHPFTDPTLVTEQEDHSHGVIPTSDTTPYYPTDNFPIRLHAYDGEGDSASLTFPGIPTSWDNATVHVKSIFGSGVKLLMTYRDPANAWGATRSVWVESGEQRIGIGAIDWSAFSAFDFVFTAYEPAGVVPGDYLDILSCSIDVTVSSSIEPAKAAVSTGISTSGASADSGDKEEADVDDLAADNAALQVTGTQAATRSVVNLFDVTEYVNFAWAWFTDKDITVEYKGTVDAKDVYLLHAFFDIEYRKKEIVFSDEVTCEVTGLIDDASGTYTGTANALITRPDHVRKYLLCHRGGLPTGYIDGTSFLTAGSRYAALGHYFDGLLNADLTVRDAEKKLVRQCRSRWFWNAGKAKIAVREKLENWSIDRDLSASDMRLRALSLERGRMADLVNTITLFYQRNWISGEGGTRDYEGVVKDRDTDSVADHGVCEKRDDFLFDCVARDAMAQDLLDFYLEEGAYPSTFYTLEGYLEQFDLEKEDIITVTSAVFSKIRKARMAVRALDRVFGSGKTGRMNSIRIVAECLRYILLEQSMADTVKALDVLSIEWEFDINRADLIVALEELKVAVNVGETDTVTAADEITNILMDWNPTIFEQGINEPDGFGEGGFGVRPFGSKAGVRAADELICALRLALSDEVTVSDQFAAYVRNGFGGGGFGVSGFGGYITWQSFAEPHTALVSDVLGIFMDVVINSPYGFGLGGFGETEFGEGGDMANVADQLAFSDGYGGVKFGGFGEGPFGS